MTSLVHGAVQHGRTGELLGRARGVWGTVREDSFPFTSAQFQAAVQDLRELSERWARTPAGGVLDVEWPDDPSPGIALGRAAGHDCWGAPA